MARPTGSESDPQIRSLNQLSAKARMELVAFLQPWFASIKPKGVGGGGGAFNAVWGALFNDAGVIAGSGFTASWDNNGGAPINDNYITVYFDTPFTNPPVVVLAPNNNNPPSANGRYTATLLTRTTGYVVVITENVDDPDSLANQNGGFDFLCIEPGV